jgi:Alpha-2,8-polysialyltransferase (POLYST)
MRETRRLVFVHGPWQLLIAAGALEQASRSAGGRSRDTLVVFPLPDGQLAPPILGVIRRIAAAVWPWDRVVVFDDPIRGDLGEARGCVEAARALLQEESADEVWLECLWGTSEKIFAEAYPKARLVLYEDGLHVYLPGEDHHISAARLLGDPRGTYRALKLRVRERRHPDSLAVAAMLPRHLARVAASYLWISQMLPPADYQRRLPLVQLQTRFVREALARVSPLVEDIGLEPADGPRALLLGHCFSNFGDLEREVELDCYVDMANRLQGMGYEVIWKEHPRTRQPFLAELADAVPGVRGAPDWGPWPVELLVERLGLSACASITSTSLFTIPLLFGLPSFSAAARLLPLFRFPADELARLVAGSIPRLADGPAAPVTGAAAPAGPVAARAHHGGTP